MRAPGGTVADRRGAVPQVLHASSFDLRIDPQRVFQVLLVLILALAVLSTAAGALMCFFSWREGSFGFEMVRLFWLDTEHNIPTLYQCSVMFAASLLFVLVGQRYHRLNLGFAAPWYVLAAAFTFLAWDEGAQIHETIGIHFGTSFDGSWLYFYVPATALLFALLVPFLRRLPARTRGLLLVSGACYVGGAVGVEFAGQLYAQAHSRVSLIYGALATLEEVLEMFGVALLIFALLDHLGSLSKSPAPNTGITS